MQFSEIKKKNYVQDNGSSIRKEGIFPKIIMKSTANHLQTVSSRSDWLSPTLYLDPDAAPAQSGNRGVVVELEAVGDAMSANAPHLSAGGRRRRRRSSQHFARSIHSTPQPLQIKCYRQQQSFATIILTLSFENQFDRIVTRSVNRNATKMAIILQFERRNSQFYLSWADNNVTSSNTVSHSSCTWKTHVYVSLNYGPPLTSWPQLHASTHWPAPCIYIFIMQIRGWRTKAGLSVTGNSPASSHESPGSQISTSPACFSSFYTAPTWNRVAELCVIISGSAQQKWADVVRPSAVLCH